MTVNAVKSVSSVSRSDEKWVMLHDDGSLVGYSGRVKLNIHFQNHVPYNILVISPFFSTCRNYCTFRLNKI